MSKKGGKKRPCANPYKHPAHTWNALRKGLQECPGVGRGAH